MSHYLKVYGRLRPSANGNSDTAMTVVDKTHVRIEADGKAEKTYELHRIFSSDASQQDVFTSVAQKLTEECTEGINVTIFAYGQTGSGKTHTMLGPSDSWSDPLAKGLIPRTIEHLFDILEKKAEECQKFSFQVDVEFVELYNEEIFDLLSVQSSSKINLRDIGNDIVLAGAKAESVDNSLDLMKIVKRGWQSRRTGATAMNRDSSRSHALLIIKISVDEVNGDMRTTRKSTLNLVDLAGSERQAHTKSSGERLKEATNINSSLTVLGRCIRMLAKPTSAQSFIPYRDSYLTHILKNSLGGNSKTAVIVNMHPDRSFISESSSTLQFAEACTLIKNKVLRNEIMSGDQENSYKKAIQQLRQEIDETRAKAREEFARRLDDTEEHLQRLAAENTALKAETAELRSKYNVGLVKYRIGTNCELPSHIKEFVTVGDSEDEVYEKMRTLKFELEASEKRCQDLQEERDENAEKFLNTTFNFQTPRVKKRQSSSRNPRRETLYKPSPAIDDEESDSDTKLQESEIRIATLEAECQTLKNKLEKALEDMYKEQEARETAAVSSQAKIESLTAQVDELNSENGHLTEKVMKGGETLTSLLTMIETQKVDYAHLKNEKAAMEEKFGKEFDELREHYATHQQDLDESQGQKLFERDVIIDNLNKSYAILTAENEQLLKSLKSQGQKLSERDVTIDNLNKSCALVTAEKEQLRESLNAKEVELKRIASEMSQKTGLIAQLEQSVQRSSSAVSEVRSLKAELERTAGLEADLRIANFKLEESQNNEKQLLETIEKHKKERADAFAGHQTDLRNIKFKAEEEVKDREKSLETAKKALALHKKTSQEQQKAANQEFDEKMASMKKLFESSKLEALEQAEAKVRDEVRAEFKKQRERYESTICTLQGKIESLQKQHDDDSNTINSQLGTRKDKMSYIDKTRQKLIDKDVEIEKLRQENAKLSAAARDGSVKTRVLRSRNPN